MKIFKSEEHPILFNAEMVRAILDGRKTQTRRVIMPSVKGCGVGVYTTNGKVLIEDVVNVQEDGDPWTDIKCPYGTGGDRLWVREHWGYGGASSCGDVHKSYAFYHADPSDTPKRAVRFKDFDEMTSLPPHQNLKYPEGYDDLGDYQQADIKEELLGKWWKRIRSVPSIHMPRWASRITLDIASIRVERVGEIDAADCYREGIVEPNPVEKFKTLWNSVYEKRGQGWSDNPWVWVIDFKLLTLNEEGAR